ncbi:MAG TPA: hypothetical protein VGD56_13030 [Gemmatirosa sp.]
MSLRGRTQLAAAVAFVALGATPAHAHRLNEYLQATTISVQKGRITAQLRLTPGVAVFPSVFAGIDTDRNGVLSPAEQRAYAQRVLRDLSLAVDGERLPLRLVAATFATPEAMQEGLGEIQLEVEAVVPGDAGDRQLTFENRHMRQIGVYLVNTLVPRDPDIRVTAQERNYEQSFYRLDYTQSGASARARSLAAWSGPQGWFGMAALLPVAWAVLRRQRRAEVGDAPRVAA